MGRVLRTVERAASINLDTTTQQHWDDIARSLEGAKNELSKSHTVNQANGCVIECLIEIVFQLLGDLPSNDEAHSTSNDAMWKLDKYRKIVYVLTDTQRARRAFALANNNDNDLFMTYSKYRKDSRQFLEWLVKNRPELYRRVSALRL